MPPDAYVIAIGETHSSRDFLDKVVTCLDLAWHQYIEIDPPHYRPVEGDVLLGIARARPELGWGPTVTFRELARMTVDEDMQLARKEAILNEHGEQA